MLLRDRHVPAAVCCHKSCAKQRPSANHPWLIPRRQMLLGSTALVSGISFFPALYPSPVHALELDQVFAGPRFSFSYPASFVVAYDRERAEYGSLVAVADYNKYLTFSVERERAPPGAAGVCFCACGRGRCAGVGARTPLCLCV